MFGIVHHKYVAFRICGEGFRTRFDTSNTFDVAFDIGGALWRASRGDPIDVRVFFAGGDGPLRVGKVEVSAAWGDRKRVDSPFFWQRDLSFERTIGFKG